LSCTFFMHVCCVNSIKYEYEYKIANNFRVIPHVYVYNRNVQRPTTNKTIASLNRFIWLKVNY